MMMIAATLEIRAGGRSVLAVVLGILLLLLAPPSSHRRIVTPVCAALSRRSSAPDDSTLGSRRMDGGTRYRRITFRSDGCSSKSS